jgi:hypothetical protein
MLTNKFRLSLLALVVPVAGLGVLAALNRATTAQVSEDLNTIARQQVAKLSRLPLTSLTVVNSAKVEYPLQGKTVFDFKVSDKESGCKNKWNWY